MVWSHGYEPPPGYFQALADRVPFPWILRSSSPDEDTGSGSLAGCFESIGPVHGLSEAQNAFSRIRLGLDAACRIGALVGVAPKVPAVLIQPYVSFVSLGTVLWPDPSREQTLLVETAAGTKEPDPLQKEEICRLVHRVCREFFGYQPVDMEWGVDSAGKLWLLQVRSLVRGAENPPEFMQAGTWRLNRHHHPRVLSPLYASVIEKTRDCLLLRQGVWMGRLYESSDAPVPNGTGTFPRAPVSGPFLDSRRRFHRMLSCFFRFLPDYLERRRPVRPGENCLAALLRAMPHSAVPHRFHSFASVFPEHWDPEAPSIASGIGELVNRFREPAQAPEELPWQVFANRVDSREQDDWVFARMIAALRAALLQLAEEASLVLDRPDDVFCMNVDEILSGNLPDNRILQTRRVYRDALEHRIVPEKVLNGVPVYRNASPTGTTGRLSGYRAVGGKATGLSGNLHQKAEIAVVYSLTPQDIVFLPQVAGLIVERPELAGHAVLIARELGIPAIVGVQNAVRLIPPGTRVFLDADAAVVDLVTSRRK